MEMLTAAMIAVEEKADLLRGPKGVKGDRGEPGVAGKSIKGERGEPGPAGKSITGPRGLSGKDGRDGVDGKSITGPAGKLGPAGKDGVGPDEKVRVSQDDPKAGFLADKLTAGSGIEIRTAGGKRGERLVIDAKPQGGGGGGQSGIIAYDDGVAVGAGNKVSFDGGDPVTISGGLIHVPVGSGAGGDFIPQGGPLTEDLLAGGFALRGADDGAATGSSINAFAASGTDGGIAFLLGGDGDGGATGAQINAEGGSGEQGGSADLTGGTGLGASRGGNATLSGGASAGFSGAYVKAGAATAAADGTVEIQTNSSTGDALDVLTAQGDGTALWAPGGIPQGGPFTADLDTAGFGLAASGDGNGLALNAADGITGDGGSASFFAGTAADGNGGGFLSADGGGNASNGGNAALGAGNAIAGLPGGTATLRGGRGDAGNDERAHFRAYGGDGAGNAGRVEIQTDDTTGSSGDLLTAQGDGTALWVSPSGLPGSPETYTETNVVTDRGFDASAYTLDELANVMGTLLGDLRTRTVTA